MYKPKTKPTAQTVEDFLGSTADERKRADSLELIKMMKRVTRKPPKMWGPSIIGFGSYHYKYESGHEGDSALAAFSPRKQSLVVYIAPWFKSYPALMKRLGKHKTGLVCVYIKKLDDIDRPTLEELIKQSVAYTKEKYG